jgi:S1-C subfamily serine protease
MRWSWEGTVMSRRTILSGLLLGAAATWSGCASSGPLPLPVTITRHPVSVVQLRTQIESRRDSLEYPEGIWSISWKRTWAGQTQGQQDFSRVVVVRAPSNPREFIELPLSDPSANPKITATFSALANRGVFASRQWDEQGTEISFRFQGKNWMQLVGTRTGLFDGRSLVEILTYDRVWPVEPLPRDQTYFRDNISGEASESPRESARSSETHGSGFILPSLKLAATNFHVIEGGTSVEVWNPKDNTWYPSRVVRSDPANDLALIEIPDILRPASSIAAYGVQRSADIRVGEEIHAMGFPLSSVLGSSPRFTSGTISADVGIADDPRLVQMTAPIQPGNSGGPLVNAFGDVTGVVVSTLSSSLFLELTGSVPQNVNFAIKIDYLRLLAGNDFGDPGVTPAAALPGSEVAERMAPWIVRIRAILR